MSSISKCTFFGRGLIYIVATSYIVIATILSLSPQDLLPQYQEPLRNGFRAIGINQLWTMFSGGDFSPTTIITLRVHSGTKIIKTVPLRNRAPLFFNGDTRFWENNRTLLRDKNFRKPLEKWLCKRFANSGNDISIHIKNFKEVADACSGSSKTWANTKIHHLEFKCL